MVHINLQEEIEEYGQYESWREELKAYVKEADKYNKEHNWFDYVPGRGKSLIIKRRDVTREKVSPIGIRKSVGEEYMVKI